MLANLLDGALDTVEEMTRKRVPVAVLGLSGHIFYFLLWTQVYPQPYEAPMLRLVLGSMFIVFLMPRRWLRQVEPGWPVYWHVTVMLNLPFFFTYMALRNDTFFWAASLPTALLLVYLVTTGTLAALLIVAGVSAGALLAVAAGVDNSAFQVGQAWPLLLFALFGAIVLSRSREQHSRHKTAALLSYAGYIAHELRTPLASIAARASLSRLSGAALGEEHGRHLEELSREVQRAFALIDILLTNVDPLRHARSQDPCHPEFNKALISSVLTEALMRYPFRDEGERARVQVNLLEDCPVRGSPLLLQHVVMNVVRNAFEHGRAHMGLSIVITARRRVRACELSIEDNGLGPSTRASDHEGLGLTFCRNVARSVGGDLQVRLSAAGGYAVLLTLPSAD